MKCSKCGNDLGIESNSAEKVEYCSFCAKHNFPEGNSIEEVLRWIVQDRGVNVFQNSGVINAILSDLAPKDEKGRIKIKNAMAVGAGDYFYGVVQQGTLNEVSRKQFLSDLSSNGFTIEFCNFIFDVFAYSINQSVAVQEKETSKTSANDSYKNIAVNTEQNNENVSHNTKTDTKRDKNTSYSKKLELNALKQCPENRQIFGKDIRIPLPIILKFDNFDGYRLFSISNEHYSYGTRDFTKHKLEGFWKDFKPYGYMKRTTQGETWIEYYDEDGNFVKKFTKNELPKIFQFTNKIRMNYFNLYGSADIENSRSLVYVEYETKDGNGYRGTAKVLSNKSQGFGVAHYTSGNQFYGKFQEGVPSIGIILNSDGTIFRGTFKDGLLKGRGMVQWANGDIYEGDFQEGVRTGRGIIKWADGTIYEGDFLSNQCHGEGTMAWPDGTIYYGDWINGKRDGAGVKILPDRKQYLQIYSQGNLINERDK